MGDAQDGSSNAAQSAQQSDSGTDSSGSTERRSLWARLKSTFATAPAPGEPETRPVRINGSAVALGLGNLRLMRVEDVMLPKAEIVAVPLHIRKDALVEVFRNSGLTRLPVYDGTLDTPAGMVHLKDFALEQGFNGSAGRFSLRTMMRPLLYAPPSMPIGVLLQKMQSERMHMALVIDEYGGVDGLVTIEDLIEQVVGEIEDEHDTEEDRFWTVEGPGCYLAVARTPLDEFEAETGRKLADPEDDEEVDTLGGLVFKLAGRVPARGEVIRHPDGPEFEVVDADPRRIKRLRVRLSGSRANG